jgi:hypothetical protein
LPLLGLILVAGLTSLPGLGPFDPLIPKAAPIELADWPAPTPKPRLTEAVREAKSTPRPRPDAATLARPALGLPRLAPGAHAACMSDLHEAGIKAEVLPPIQEESCGMRWPLRLEEIGEGEEAIRLMPPAKVRCPIVDALATWLDDAVQPAAEEHLGGRVTGLRIAGSYVCRSRNHTPGARLSEHSRGNAIDIAAVEIAGGEWVTIGPRTDGTAPEAHFMRSVREAACTYFHTVLGPGSDAYHTDHFHLDLARRGASGTRRYCR